MKKSIANILLLTLLIAFVSCESKRNKDSKMVAEEQNDANLKNSDLEKDSEFAVTAADGGLLEVQLATLARTKATSSRVKEYAQMMIDDHTKTNDELKSWASQKNVVLPDVMSEKCQKKYYDIDQKNGSDFDKEYIDLMVKDHKDDINKFEKEADKGNDPELKSWAAGKLATLRHHLEQAQAIQDDLKDNKKSN